MSDMRPDRDDFIHRVFRHLRSGFSDIVVNLVDRVDKRLEIFIDDERHAPPEMDKLAVDAVRHTAGVLSSAITDLVASDAPPDTPEDSDGPSAATSTDDASDTPDNDS